LTSTAMNKEEEEYLDYLKALQDRKEYNLRTTNNARALNNSFNEKELLRKSGLMRGYKGSNKKTPLITTQEPIADGFYDDFPPEIIKRYKLKVSQKIQDL